MLTRLAITDLSGTSTESIGDLAEAMIDDPLQLMEIFDLWTEGETN